MLFLAVIWIWETRRYLARLRVKCLIASREYLALTSAGARLHVYSTFVASAQVKACSYTKFIFFQIDNMRFSVELLSFLSPITPAFEILTYE